MRRRPIDILRLRLRSLFQRSQVEGELEKELAFHLEQALEEGRESGLTSEEARNFALQRLGGVTQIKEGCRDMRGNEFLETLGQDLRYAFRTQLRNPGFTLVIVLTLALSIGATSAMVSVFEGVLLRPLPFHNPRQLVRLFTSSRGWPKFPMNPNDFRDFRSRVHSFESMAAYTHRDLQLAGTGEAVRLSGFSVTAGYFHVLGLKPAIGREFDTTDELPAKGNVAIVSDKVWRNRLGGRRDVLGQKVLFDQVPYSVVGVMPPGVQHPGNMYHAVAYGDTADVWVPFTFQGDNRGSHYMDCIARLRPGITLAQALGEMNAAMQQLGREHPDNAAGWKVLVVPLETEIVGRSRDMLFALLGAVALVLLLACVNAANLLLARATARQREIAVRAAVGADRPRLVRQMLTESLLLALMSATLGALLAVAGVRTLLKVLPADFPRAADIHVDAPVFLFTVFIALATGVVFGIVPALQTSRADLRGSLHESGRSVTGTQQALLLRSGLVVSEVTLACVLLIGAGLLLRSFLNLIETDPGFQPRQVLTASISLPSAGYKDQTAVTKFSRQLLANVRGIAGVTAAGLGSDLPWTGWDDNAGGFQIRGETPPPHEDFSARYHTASSGYFGALGIAMLRGRSFNEHDTADGRNVLIINQALARYWQRGPALGGQITFSDHPKETDWMTIVGVAADVKDTPASLRAKPAFWWPLPQAPFPFGNLSIAVRSSLDPALLAGRLRRAVKDLDGGLAVADIRTMDEVAAGAYSTARFAFVLISIFAGLALLLAAIGTYGVMAYSVNQRVHEFGVRMALGAGRWDLLRSVLVNGLKLALWGVSAGIVVGMAFSRLLASLLYGVSASDPLAIGATGLITIVVAALACSIPAWRATRADPMTALRAD